MIKIQEIKPLLCCLPIIHTDKITFEIGDKKINIFEYNTELKEIFPHLKGFLSVKEITDKLDFENPKLVGQLVAFLIKKNIIVDSRQQFWNFHNLTKYPDTFGIELTDQELSKIYDTRSQHSKNETISDNLIKPSYANKTDTFLDICAKRSSVREFGIEPITNNQLFGILQSISASSIASAGGLYSNEIWIRIQNCQSVPKGLYKYQPISQTLLPLDIDVFDSDMQFCFDSATIHLSGTIIFVVCNMQFHTQKYSNRGYKFSVMEAGAIGQNAHLYCANQNLGVYQCGGYREDFVNQKLNLTDCQTVISTIIIGSKLNGTRQEYIEEKTIVDYQKQLEKDLVSKNIVTKIHTYSMKSQNKENGLLKSVASYKEQSGIIATGHATGETTSLTKLKAMAEAFERHQSGDFFFDFFGSSDEITQNGHQFLDVQKYLKLNSQYQDNNELTNFDPTTKKYWVKGRYTLNDEMVYILADTVFYPCPDNFGNTRYMNACSNGISAHSTVEKAIEGGLLELIERDAMMVCWYAKRVPKILRSASLSKEVQNKVKYWQQKGFDLVFLDLTIDSVPVVMACLFSDQYPCFMAGCCSNYIYEVAIAKSLGEVEVIMNYHINNVDKKVDKIEKKDIDTIIKHAYQFFYPETLPELEFLRSGEMINCPEDINIDIIQKYNPIIINLGTDPNICDLKVVKVIVPELIDINFGYGSECYDHPRYAQLGLTSPQYPANPHFFA